MNNILYSNNRYEFYYYEGFSCIKESNSFFMELRKLLGKPIKIHLINGNIITGTLKNIDKINNSIVVKDEKEKKFAFKDWEKIIPLFSS